MSPVTIFVLIFHLYSVLQCDSYLIFSFLIYYINYGEGRGSSSNSGILWVFVCYNLTEDWLCIRKYLRRVI